MTDIPKRSNEEAGRTCDPHPYEECTEPHLFRRFAHCRCGEPKLHPNHPSEKEAK